MSTSAVLLVMGLLLLAYMVFIYNKLISQKNQYLNAFSQIDVQLQRRYELIPNLVEIASKYLSHERETLTAVVEARNQAKTCSKAASASPENLQLMNALANAENTLGSAMGKLNIVMEDYPELQANESLQALHEELSSTENRVGYARQAYSDAVMHYNISREEFPALFIAKLFSFEEANLFEMEEHVNSAPVNVSFA